MHHEMKVFGFSLDSLTSKPMVILKDARDDTTLPIWISSSEALAIAAQLVSLGRPGRGEEEGPHVPLPGKTGMEVGAIVIDDLTDGVFTATSCSGAAPKRSRWRCVPAKRSLRPSGTRCRSWSPERFVQRASLVAVSSEEIAGET